MGNTLGLDLGTNSIGWALVDETKNEILGMGSRIFPEGVVNLGEGLEREISKSASRREDRGARRQSFRRRLRKKVLLKTLMAYNMCPLTKEDLDAWNATGRFPEEKLKDWFDLSPYPLRAKAIEEEISLLELGRVFYHMIQRRGFQSNSRSAGAKENEKSTIFRGDPKVGKIGISETYERMQEHETLGSYLNEIAPANFQPYKSGKERIRNRYTTRQMYIDEFELIWEKQKNFHPELDESAKTVFGGCNRDAKNGVLFYQRPLRSQKHLVGNCSFEPKKTKCPKSAIPFETFRVYQWVNNVMCNLKKLSDEEKEAMVKVLFSKKSVKFSALRKAINKQDSNFQFNFRDDDKIEGTETISQLSNKKFFGAGWFAMSEAEQEHIWHILYSFDDRDKLKKYAEEHWGFDDKKAEEISKFNLKDGYASLSRKAILNILPFLKTHTYDVAVALGGVKNAFGTKWEDLKDFELEMLYENVSDIVHSGARGGYIKALKHFLSKEFDFTEKEFKKLYHHSSNIHKRELMERLPVDPKADQEIQSIKNPVVITALFELRRLVNELIDDYGEMNTVKIELARDLRISKKARNEKRYKQKKQEQQNDRVKAELKRLGQRITRDNIVKYKLWEECNQTCPFTGRKIGIHELFTGNVQIEHIHPWSKSLNDSFMNKTLCFADENRAKGNRTPFEFYSSQGEEKWEMVKAQAQSCFKSSKEYPESYYKFKHFVKRKHDHDFVSRQLNDTRYISKEAKNYLGKICANVLVAPGQATAHLRRHWGLNTILNTENIKKRNDHRHHAIDALVMACTNQGHLQELARWNSASWSSNMKNFPKPWDTFRTDAEKKVNAILVSHRKLNKTITARMFKTKKRGVEYTNLGIAARGQLHKETVYGKRKSPGETEHSYHVRKPLETRKTKKHVEDIVDPVIRKLIQKRIDQMGGYEKGKNIPKGAFFEEVDGVVQPRIFLPNKNGAEVPVNKVRVRSRLGGAEPLKEDVNKYVNPSNNHHVIIYKDEGGAMREEVVTQWKAVERKLQQQSVYQLPEDGVEMVTTLKINDMFLLNVDPNQELKDIPLQTLSKHLYRVQKVSSKKYCFRKHTSSVVTDAEFKTIQSFGNGKTGWETFTPVKVKVTSTGKIEKI